MKAAFIVGPKKFEIRQVNKAQPGHKDLVANVKACGVCGSDLRRWKEGPPEPYVPGHEIAAEVIYVGNELEQFSVGDRIAVAPDIHCGKCYYCRHALFNLCDNLKFLGITPGFPGGFAEQILLTDEVLNLGIVHKIPEDMPYEHAAVAEPCSSVLACHQQAGTSIGDIVLVMGAGPIGCLHTAVAKARGAKVIVSEPSEVRREIAKSFEPDFVVDPFNEDLLQITKQVTSGLGVDIAICANPIPATQTQAVEIVRKRGKVILFGGLPKSNNMVPYDGNLIHYNEISILGSFSYHPDFHGLALDALAQNVISAEKIISKTYSLENIDEAFNLASSGDALKVLVKPE